MLLLIIDVFYDRSLRRTYSNFLPVDIDLLDIDTCKCLNPDVIVMKTFYDRADTDRIKIIRRHLIFGRSFIFFHHQEDHLIALFNRLIRQAGNVIPVKVDCHPRDNDHIIKWYYYHLLNLFL